MNLVLAASGIFLIVFVSEILWRNKYLSAEGSRKFTHILSGTFIASWPLFINMSQVRVMCLWLLLGILLSRTGHILRSIHSVQRKTWGDILFPVGIGLTALLTQNPWIFAVAVLHLALADGLAATMGTAYGQSNRFKVFDETRSLVGFLTFMIVSFVILTTVVTPLHPTLSVLLLLPLVGACVESLVPLGTDNVFVPLLIVTVLRVV